MQQFITLVVVCCAIAMFSCEPKGKEAQDNPEVFVMTSTPLCRTLVKECTERVLRVGQYCLLYEGSQTRVRLMEIAQDGNSCKLEVENPRAGTKSSEWVRAEEYATFQEFGTSGLQVIRLEADQAVLGFYSGRSIPCNDEE